MTNTRSAAWPRLIRLAALVIAAALCATASPASAQEKIKIGIVGPFSGPFATVGVMFRQGIETYTTMHGTRAGDREIELLYRDTAGTDPAVSKRLTEELVIRDKVSLLGGYYLSPEAIAAAPVVNETKTPAVLFFAGATGIPKLSPYFIRTGSTNASHAEVIAAYALKRDWKRVYIAVADYAPGHDMQAVFKARVSAAGGTVLGEDRIPLNTVDYAPFAERVSRAKPDAVLGFIPNGAPAVAWYKALSAQGVLAAKIPVIGISETDDMELSKFDDSLVGTVYSAIFYSPGAPGEANKKFKDALTRKFPGVPVSFAQESAFEAMHILYSMVASQKGKPFNGDDALKAVQGLQWDSPRGPMRVIPGTGETEHNIFVRRVEKVDGRLTNVIVDTFQAQPPQ